MSAPLRLALLALTACAADPDPPAPTLAPVRYADVTRAAGIDFVMRSGGRTKNYIVEAKGGGGAFFDYDGDGQLDIYLVNGSRFGTVPDSAQTNVLYRNAGSGAFRETTRESGGGDSGWGMGCAVADYDNDGDPDLYVTNYGPNVLYRNEGGAFTPAPAGVDLDGWSTSATFGDYDLDGDLDLYVAQYVNFAPDATPPRGGMWKGVLVFAGPLGLPGAQDALYRNEGDGRFSEVTRRAKAGKLDPTYGLGAL
ncbi:MAG: VCBS repeat-containing protein, partial [Candidatus Latescibacteria bacterium]|nr:VCBS repeat-containing protein [Candidatus Latescibacterota bacterium]